jgi:hypothetical protein
MNHGSATSAFIAINNLLKDPTNLTNEEYQTLTGMRAYFLNYIENYVIENEVN